jgi:phage gpG-like protein
MSATAVTDTDRGAQAMVSRLRALAQSTRRVKVGILGDSPKKAREGATGKLSLLEVAALHEFGAPEAGIPQRSFIRATIDEKRVDIERLQFALAKRVALGEITEEQALQMIGAKVAGWVKTRIAEGIAPALAPATVAKKKSSKPLVDTGQLRSSITHVVEG